MRKRNFLIIRTILITTFLLTIISHFSLSFVSYVQQKKIFRKLKSTIQENYISFQREILKNEVTHALGIIENERKNQKITKEKTEVVQQRVLNSLAVTRLRGQGYIYVNTIDGDALILDGKKTVKTTNISELLNLDGKKIFDMQKETAVHKKGGFYNCYWQDENNLSPSLFISYVEYDPEWQWIIGAGFFFHNISSSIKSSTAKFDYHIKRHVRYSIIIFLITSLLAMAIYYFLANFLQREFVTLFQFFRNNTTDRTLIRTEKLYFPELKLLAEQINRMLKTRHNNERDLEELVTELQKTLAENVTLKGLIPICSYCKKIRDDQGYWNNLEQFIAAHSEATFSHGICPDCLEDNFGSILGKDDSTKKTK